MNLIEEMQKATGHWPVEKIDPNTQAPKDEQADNKNLLAQAVIPVSLLGLYHFTRSAEQAQSLVGGNNSTRTDWKNKLYGNHSEEVAGSVASYAHTSKEIAEDALNHAVVIEKTVNDIYTLTFDYLQMNLVMRIVKENDLTIISQQFDNSCSMQLAIRKMQVNQTLSKLTKVVGIVINYNHSL